MDQDFGSSDPESTNQKFLGIGKGKKTPSNFS
jgi:hypothetical protein